MHSFRPFFGFPFCRHFFVHFLKHFFCPFSFALFFALVLHFFCTLFVCVIFTLFCTFFGIMFLPLFLKSWIGKRKYGHHKLGKITKFEADIQKNKNVYGGVCQGRGGIESDLFCGGRRNVWVFHSSNEITVVSLDRAVQLIWVWYIYECAFPLAFI